MERRHQCHHGPRSRYLGALRRGSKDQIPCCRGPDPDRKDQHRHRGYGSGYDGAEKECENAERA